MKKTKTFALIAFAIMQYVAYSQINISGFGIGHKKDKNKDQTQQNSQSEQSSQPTTAPQDADSQPKSMSDADKQKILDVENTDQFKKDYANACKINAILNNSDNDDKKETLIDTFDILKPIVDGYVKQYADYISISSSSYALTFKSVKERADGFKDGFKNSDDPAGKAKAALQQAAPAIQKIKANDYKNAQELGTLCGSVSQPLHEANWRIHILKMQKGSADNDYKNLLAEYTDDENIKAEANKKYYDDLVMERVQKTESPVDEYKGVDKASLKAKVKAKWTQDYPNDKIIGIYITDENWERKRTHDWNSNYNRWDDYDRSWLGLDIVLQDNVCIKGTYHIVSENIFIDHNNGGKLDLSHVVKIGEANPTLIFTTKLK